MSGSSGRDPKLVIDSFQPDDFIHHFRRVNKFQPDVADVRLDRPIRRIVHFKYDLRPRWNLHCRAVWENER